MAVLQPVPCPDGGDCDCGLTVEQLESLFPLPVDSDGLTNTELRAAPVIVDRPGDGMNLDQLAAIGEATPGVPFVLTPTPGTFIRLWYICADPDPDASNIGVITATLVGKGGIYQQYNIAHRQRFDGDIDGTLTIDVTAGTVQVTVHYEEF